MAKIQLSDEDAATFYGLARQDLIDFCIATDRNYDPQWFHEEIAKVLTMVERREIKRLIIEVPPRHGKSQLCTINFPAWYLGRHPDHEIITASYSSDLAQKFGSSCRDLVDDPRFKVIFPGVELRQDSKAKDYWLTNKKGSYMSVGVGGGATGSGADCIAEGELVETSNGLKAIEDVLVGDFVLSFNEKDKVKEFRKVIATRCVGEKDVVSLSGRLTCTPEHRIYDGFEYIEAKDCKSVYALLPHKVRELRFDFRETFNGMEEEKAHKVLFSSLLEKLSIKKMVEKVSWLWRKDETGIKDDLLGLLQTRKVAKKTTSYKNVWLLWKEFFGEVLQKSVLFNGMQKSWAFSFNIGQEQPKVEERFGKSSVQFNLSKNKKGCKAERQQYLRYLSEESGACASLERKQIRRPSGKLNNGLPCMSHDNPQIQKLRSNDVVSVGKRKVFDIQVEGNENFFVNGILVHNCFIIDDPFKNREEADSQVFRDKVWDWYTNVARTRLEDGGVIVVIQTRWHQDDLIGRILDREASGGDKWHRITFKAVAEVEDEFRGVGDPLWPAKYSKKDLDSLRHDIGERAWFSLFQQVPVASETQVFKPEWMRKEFTPEMLDGKALNRYITIDTADTDKEGADYIGVVCVDWDADNNWYLQKVRRYKLNILGLVDLVFNLWTGDKPLKIGIEKKSFQDQLKPLLDERSEETGIYPVIEELKHGGRQKEARIIGALQGRFEKGKIWFKKGSKDDSEALRGELFDFPKGKHDDLSDAAAYISDIGARPFSPYKEVRSSIAEEISQNARAKRKPAFNRI